MFVLGVSLAVLIGVTLGLLGGGGSILTVPILLYVFKLPPEQAIASSLLVVGTTSAVALIPHARAGRVRWSTGALFGAASMVGAYAGGRLSSHLPPASLVLGFGVMMLVTAAAMMRGRRTTAASEGDDRPIPLARIAAQGVAVGAVTGIVGAGGGFLVVPALVLLGRLPMTAAVGTSLLVISMNSVAGLAGHLSRTHLPWGVALPVAAAAVLGSLAGSRLSGRIAPDTLRRGFAWFVVVMAIFVLGQEIPKLFGVTVSLARHWPWLLAAMSAPLTIAAARSSRRHAHAI